MTENGNGNKNGRPLKFQTPAELQAKIDAYFNDCNNKIINKQHVTGKGEIVIVPTPTPYTMAGLAACLEINRKNLIEYDDRDGFRSIISRARQRIEESNITLALAGCHDSRIAALNLASNYGYSQRSSVSIDFDEQLQAIIKALPEKYAIQVQAALVSLAGRKQIPER